jgi:putative oxidoreductase
MKISIINVLSILAGTAMVIFGANKFLNFIPMTDMTPEQIEMFGAFGKIKWLMPLVGLAEIIGGVLLAYPKMRALGANILLPITTGILLHIVTHDPKSLLVALVFFLINLWVIWENRARYMSMIS